MFDVVVVGARCGGAATAMLLSRKGYRVLLVDRAAFPSEVPSTSYIKAAGVARLAEWGLLDRIAASGCPPLPTMVHRVAGVRLAGTISAGRFAIAPRRSVLDQILVEAAVRAGAVFEDNCPLAELSTDSSGRVTGVSLRLAGRRVDEPAALVVGADGMRSRVARLCGARTVRDDGRLTCVYYSAWLGLDTSFGVYEKAGSWVATIPTNDAVTLVASYLPQAQFPRARAAPEEVHRRCVEDTAPEVHRLLLDGTAVGGLVGRGDQANFVRRAAGRGWALVGDAGRHSDSITATGITNAFEQAQLLANCLDGDLRDQEAVRRGLSEYSRLRDDGLDGTYADTLEVARLETPAWRLELMGLLAGSAALADAYADYVSGFTPFDDLMSAVGALA